MSNLGLVLSGGGARAAYQAGVLAAVADICSEMKIQNPFKYYTGVSAGAINSCVLATHPGTFLDGVEQLKKLWTEIQSEQVYESDVLSLTHIGLRWLSELSLGGMKQTPGKSLLDTSPLRDLIAKHCTFENIQKKIDRGEINALGVSALDFHTSSTVTFIQGIPEIHLWQRVRRQAQKANIDINHVMASAAIPLLFPAIEVENRFYGDGSIRNYSPCGPAIYMGADRILAIGVRRRQDLCDTTHTTLPSEAPSAARVASVMLNALMSDGIEFDMERIEHINIGLAKLQQTDRSTLRLRPIEALWISPSKDFSKIAVSKSEELPKMIRYLMRGLGNINESGEMTSFLLFERSYCEHLMELGFEDGMEAKDRIRALLYSGTQKEESFPSPLLNLP